MSAVVEAADLIQSLGGSARAGESVKEAIWRAARAAGIDVGLAKRLWYGEARRIDADLMDQLRNAASLKTEKDAQCAYTSLLARIEACEAALRLPHADMGGQGAHGHRGGPRGADRALDRTT